LLGSVGRIEGKNRKLVFKILEAEMNTFK
jgi:hypothetical protein